MAAEIPIIIAAEFVPVVAPIRWSQLDVQDWAHVKPIRRRSSQTNNSCQKKRSFAASGIHDDFVELLD